MKPSPDNPFYRREYVSTVRGGQACISIPAPGGKVDPEDAEHIIALLALIERQLRRDIEADTEHQLTGE